MSTPPPWPGAEDGPRPHPQAQSWPSSGPQSEPGPPPIPQAQDFPHGPGAPHGPVFPDGAGNPDLAGRSPYASAPAPGPEHGAPHGFVIPPTPKPPLDGVSLAAVITGALALSPIALGLGLLGLRRVRSSWRRSPALAWTGIGLGALGMLAWVGALGVLALAGPLLRSGEQPVPGDVASPRAVHSTNLAAGNCVEFLPPGVEVGEVRLVPCATPHAAQVVERVAWDAAEHPGDAEAIAHGREACAPVLARVDTAGAGVRDWWLSPSEQGWSQGQREVVCLLRASAGPLDVDLVNVGDDAD